MESKPSRQEAPSLLARMLMAEVPKVWAIPFGWVLIFCWLPFRMAAQGLEPTPSPSADDRALKTGNQWKVPDVRAPWLPGVSPSRC
jgi:hypothetical protein